jgi:hypothetical protein
MKTRVLIKIFTLVIFLTSYSNFHGQNVKKIFKQLQLGEIEKASEELAKFEGIKVEDEEELSLIELGNCIILSNEKSTFFNPSEALNLFQNISDINNSSITDFLTKYGFTSQIIEDTIYYGIVLESKKLNTEDAYETALTNCKSCKFESELRDLCLKAAYEECLALNTVEGYGYFLKKYSTSYFAEEITILMYQKAFDGALKVNTVEAFNKYIINYPESNLKEKAIDNRDSLALTGISRDYKSLLKYTKDYPNSKFTPDIILELPNVLFNQGLDKNDFNDLDLFLITYPDDARIPRVKEKLIEIGFYEISLNSLNPIFNDCSLELGAATSELITIRKNNKYGAVDLTGKEIIPFKYDHVSIINNSISAELNEKVSIIDISGKEITPVKYDYVRFSNNGFIVSQNGKSGFINKTGEIKIPLKYDILSDFNLEGLFYVNNNGLIGCIDTSGNEVIPIIYSQLEQSSNGYSFSTSNGVCGFINYDGEYKKPSNYIPSEVVCIDDSYLVIEKSGKKGVIDYNGNVIIPIKFDYIDIDTKAGHAIVGFKSNQYTNGMGSLIEAGYWNLQGEQITEFKYNLSCIEGCESRKFSEGMARVRIKQDKYGFIDTNGREIVVPKYDWVDNFYEGRSRVSLNRKEGFIDKTGKEITPLKYDRVYNFGKNGLALVQIIDQNHNYLSGFINKEGNEITEIKYDIDYDFTLATFNYNYTSENYFRTMQYIMHNGKKGLIDNKGNIILPIEYDFIRYLKEGLLLTKKNCEWKIVKYYSPEDQ